MSVRRRKDRDNQWYVDFVFHHATGRKERVKLLSPVNTKVGAQEYERQLRDRLLTDGTLVDRAVLFRDFAVDYEKHQKTRVRPATMKLIRQFNENYLVPFFGAMPMTSIGRRQIDEFGAWLINEKGMANSSANTVLGRLVAEMHLAVEWNVITSVPKVTKFKIPSKAPDFLSFEEAAILLDGVRKYRVAVALALKAGLRIGEILGLQWGDVDFKRSLIYVRRQRVAGGKIGPTKTGKERCVDMPQVLADELRRVVRSLNPEEFVVLDELGRPATRGRLTWALEAELFRLRIVHPGTIIGWHDLRHTYASHLVMRGVPLKVVSELLGHSDIGMTMVYAHLSPETKRDAVSVLDVPVESPMVFGIR